MSSLFLFLMVVQALVAALLVWVILMQKSEGGGLGVGGSPTGLMSARGAADFLTRATTVLATIFVVLSITLAALAVKTTTGTGIDTSLDRTATPVTTPAGPAPAANPLEAAPSPAAVPASGAAVDPLSAPAKK